MDIQTYLLPPVVVKEECPRLWVVRQKHYGLGRSEEYVTYVGIYNNKTLYVDR